MKIIAIFFSLTFSLMVLMGCKSKAKSMESIEDAVETAFSEKRYDDVYALIKPFADKGNADAEFSLGLLILGKQIKAYRDKSDKVAEEDALKWIRKAATHGNQEAMLFISDSYKFGRYGYPQNSQLAQQWSELVNNPSLLSSILDAEKKKP